MAATRKKTQLPADETPVSAPLFAKHHYLILESADGTVFYVDRNAAVTSRVVASALVELAHRADEEEDGVEDTLERHQLMQQQRQQIGSVVGGGAAASSSALSQPNGQRSSPSSSSFFILGGDVEVKCNGEKAAIATAQLPIVYPSTLVAASAAQQQQQQLQQRPGTGDGAPGGPSRGGGGGAVGGGGGGLAGAKAANAKATQQALAQQELTAQQVLQYHTVDAALSAMVPLPLTHLRLVHIPANLLELAIRYMHYKYKNDTIPDGELRQGFFGFISSCSYAPPAAGLQSAGNPFTFGSFNAFGGGNNNANNNGTFSASSPSFAASSKQRKSMGGAAGGNPPPLGSSVGENGMAICPFTGGGVAQLPPIASNRHVELLAVALLLQL